MAILLPKTCTIIGLFLALTACNQSPNPKTEPTKTPTAVASTATNDPHAGRTMANNAASQSATSQPAHVAEYKQAMNAMHEQMSQATKIANPDIAFATGMLAHHQGAIDMAKIQLKYGKDSQMRNLADTIIKAQQAEIEQMQTWLVNHKNAPITNTASMPAMTMTSHDNMMQGIMANDPDVAFAKGMIPHHQGAIDMADSEIKMGKDKTMLALAQQIKAAQAPEIKQMQDWLAKKTE